MKTLSFKSAMLALCTASVLFITSCSKTGPAGPAGAQGLQGTAGAQGPAGAAGAQGVPGTVNVMYSAWTGFVEATWAAPINEFGKNVRYYPIPVTQVTDSIINTGVVLVYLRVPSTNIVPSLLPQTFYSFTQTGNQYMGFNLLAGQIKIKFFNIDNTNDPGSFGSLVEYRYVIIPGGVKITGRSLATGESSRLDYKDYNSVKTYFNLPD